MEKVYVYSLPPAALIRGIEWGAVVVTEDEGNPRSIAEITQDYEKASLFTVYGRYDNGTATALIDLPTKEAAEGVAFLLKSLLNL